MVTRETGASCVMPSLPMSFRRTFIRPRRRGELSLPRVVPAKAGTHNPWRCCFVVNSQSKATTAAFLMTGTEYGSRPSPGRRGGYPSRFIPLLSPARRRGRQPKAAAKAAVEIGQVVKTAIECDVADPALSPARQQLRRLAQPQFVQPHGETGAGLVKQFVDVALRQSGRGGEFLRGKIRLGKTFLQDHQHCLEPNGAQAAAPGRERQIAAGAEAESCEIGQMRDRKSTRLNSSH